MKRKGFTLIELIEVVAILTILAGMIIPVGVILFKSVTGDVPSSTPSQEVETEAPADDQFSQVLHPTFRPFILHS